MWLTALHLDCKTSIRDPVSHGILASAFLLWFPIHPWLDSHDFYSSIGDLDIRAAIDSRAPYEALSGL